jgi:hypothetical protein
MGIGLTHPAASVYGQVCVSVNVTIEVASLVYDSANLAGGGVQPVEDRNARRVVDLALRSSPPPQDQSADRHAARLQRPHGRSRGWPVRRLVIAVRASLPPRRLPPSLQSPQPWYWKQGEERRRAAPHAGTRQGMTWQRTEAVATGSRVPFPLVRFGSACLSSKALAAANAHQARRPQARAGPAHCALEPDGRPQSLPAVEWVGTPVVALAALQLQKAPGLITHAHSA